QPRSNVSETSASRASWSSYENDTLSTWTTAIVLPERSRLPDPASSANGWGRFPGESSHGTASVDPLGSEEAPLLSHRRRRSADEARRPPHRGARLLQPDGRAARAEDRSRPRRPLGQRRRPA